jgi:AcrR family transcriptional regulator
MEASAAAAPSKLEGEKARRIVDAMRASIGKRGAAGSTFDVVAREAGVSRGLLHYYFGTKERLLVEVVRQDCDVRIARLDTALANASSVDQIVEALVTSLESFVIEEPDSQAVVYELCSAARHSDEIQAELAELYRRWRAHMAAALEEKQREGVVQLVAAPDSVASLLFALGDGMGMQLMADPEWKSDAAFALGVTTARGLLGASG